ncbi:SET protein, partial [Rhizoctonia solani]
MARQGQSDIEIADETFKECWDQFQNWAARHISETLRFDQLANLDDEDEEELDESLFQASLQSGTAHKVGQELRALYYDPVEIDLEDELLEPTVGPSPSFAHWMNRFTTKTIPQYSSFSHLRQQNYIRGDIWVQTRTGERIRVATGDDEEIEVQVQAQIEDEKKKRGKGKGKGKKNDDKEPEPEPPVMVNEGRMDPVDARRRIRKQKLVNLGAGDNPANNQESMPFIPPEMKRRNAKNIMLSYEASFLDIEAWQHFAVGWDNDEDIIGAETIRRLLYIHKMTEDRIDETKAIPQDISALFKTLRHRTYPDLDIIFAQDPPLPHLSIDEWCHKEEQATLESRIREKAFHICYKIDCQGIMCPTHYTARERALTEQEAHETVEAQEADNRRGRGPQTPRWRKPTVSAHKLFAQFKRLKRARCGNNCFSFSFGTSEGDSSLDIIELESEPGARVQADIETIWRVDPDAMPCDVAELSWDKVTCRQAYDIRNRLYSDLSEPEPDEDHPEFEERRGGGSINLKNAITPDLATRTLTALVMLQTDIAFETASVTPRTANSVAEGVIAKQTRKQIHVELRAVMDANAINAEWSVTQIFVRGAKLGMCTVFYLQLIDVEPWFRDGGPCMNVGILMKQWKQTVVKPSQYGNGLFLVGNVVKNTLISDQQTTRATFAFRELLFEEVADATHRNYLFDIPNYSGLTIDAGYAGNESRFANHPSNGNANCGAKYVWVGNEKHIALYATGHIWNGNELFLHYGSRYWNSEMPGGEPGAADPGEQDSDELGSEVDELYDEIEDTEQEVEYEAEESSDSSVDL